MKRRSLLLLGVSVSLLLAVSLLVVVWRPLRFPSGGEGERRPLGPWDVWVQDWRRWAGVAWSYFQPGAGLSAGSGLPKGDANWARSSDWGIASYLFGVLAAERIGLVAVEGEWGVRERVSRVLRFLGERELSQERLPYQFYDMDSGGLPPEIPATLTNPSDSGRLLLALDAVRRQHPEFRMAVDAVVARGDYGRLAGSEDLGADSVFRHYVAKGFHAFDLATPHLKPLAQLGGGRTAEVYGLTLPATAVIAEPLLLAVLEGVDDVAFRRLAFLVYRAQEARYAATGYWTAFSEGGYVPDVYFVYEYVVQGSGTWVVVSAGGQPVKVPAIYPKTAFAFLAIYGTEYARRLVDFLGGLASPMGFYEGVLQNGTRIEGRGSENNGLILEAAAYAWEKLDLRFYPYPFVSLAGLQPLAVVANGNASSVDVRAAQAALAGLQGWSGVSGLQVVGDWAFLERDQGENVMVFGGPFANAVAGYVARLRDAWGGPVSPVWYDVGLGALVVGVSGSRYGPQFDTGGRVAVDYAVIELVRDRGRVVLLCFGIGGNATLAAGDVLQDFGAWRLEGRAVVLKVWDSNGDGVLDSKTVVERVP